MESHAGPFKRYIKMIIVSFTLKFEWILCLTFFHSLLFFLLIVFSIQRPVMATLCIECVVTCAWTAPASHRQTHSNWCSMNSQTPGWELSGGREQTSVYVDSRSRSENSFCDTDTNFRRLTLPLVLLVILSIHLQVFTDGGWGGTSEPSASIHVFVPNSFLKICRIY